MLTLIPFQKKISTIRFDCTLKMIGAQHQQFLLAKNYQLQYAGMVVPFYNETEQVQSILVYNICQINGTWWVRSCVIRGVLGDA